ncbi:aminoglycoside phosphotransferase family protein [Nocardioides humilatus]|uniref:aminoglycoside phosphotransferase family protein n=1 Tax=Nocardioides humilatus TaxID=2607660 RepID=UPI00165F5B16|nr:aminoglycoside phosphotransferase family protein [Nocardioides humilatus]
MTWSSAVWGTGEFASELLTFVTDAVGEPTVFEPLKIRPWSTVWRVEVGGEKYWAKQNCPGQAHEAALLSALQPIAPDYVVPVVAADPGRDLLLTPHLGVTLHERGGDHDVDLWCRIVRDAALLQRAAAPHIDDLPLTALAPECATTYVADAVGRLNALAPDDPRRLPDDVARRLEALLPRLESWSDQVGELDLPLTINHNDLHANNVVAGADDRPLRFFDFGDAMATEPLGALLIALNISADELDAGPDDLRLRRIADAALEVWSDHAPMRSLRAALPAALQLARLAKIESWRRCITTMTPEERGEYGSAPADWLGTLLEEPPVGYLPPM